MFFLNKINPANDSENIPLSVDVKSNKPEIKAAISKVKNKATTKRQNLLLIPFSKNHNKMKNSVYKSKGAYCINLDIE